MSDTKFPDAVTVLEDGDMSLNVSRFDEIPLSYYATIASCGHDGIIHTKTAPNKISIQPCDKWSSQTENGLIGIVKKGETLILSKERLKL